MNKKLCQKILWGFLILLVLYFLSNLISKDTIEGNTDGMIDTITDEEQNEYSKKWYGDKGSKYRGNVSKTITGKTCQNWSSQTPHKHTRCDSNDPKATTNAKAVGGKCSFSKSTHGIGDHNYCRNPDPNSTARPWCYTNDNTKRWELCPWDELKKADPSKGIKMDKNNCTKDLPYSWDDVILRGGDGSDNIGGTKEKSLEMCKNRCIKDYECDYFKWGNGKCHIFKKLKETSNKTKDNIPICKVKRDIYTFPSNENTLNCMSEKGKVFGTKLIGGVNKHMKDYVTVGALQYKVKGTENVSETVVNKCHENCFNDPNCRAYSWIPKKKGKGGITLLEKGKECDTGGGAPNNDSKFTKAQCANICKGQGMKFMSHGRKAPGKEKQCVGDKDKCRCYCTNTCKYKKHASYRIYGIEDKNIELGSCYHFNKSQVKDPKYRAFTLENKGEKQGISANKEVCMKSLKRSDVVKYTDILRGEFSKWPCGTMCKREKFSKNESGRLKRQEDIMEKLISDVRYHSAFIIVNDSSDEDIKGIYMLDMDHWIKERKLFIFEKLKNEKRENPNANFLKNYGHRLVWKNQKNNGVTIIVNITRDPEDIVEDILSILLIKDKKVLSSTKEFFTKWSDPYMEVHFLGWNKKHWKISQINMLRKIESKVLKYNYCDEKMKGDKVWEGDDLGKCSYPKTKRYNNKDDVIMSNIDALSKQQGFMRRLELCTSGDGDMDICGKLDSSLRFT